MVRRSAKVEYQELEYIKNKKRILCESKRQNVKKIKGSKIKIKKKNEI